MKMYRTPLSIRRFCLGLSQLEHGRTNTKGDN